MKQKTKKQILERIKEIKVRQGKLSNHAKKKWKRTITELKWVIE